MASGDKTVIIWDGFFSPATTDAYDLGSTSYIWDNAFINKLISLEFVSGAIEDKTATAGGVACSPGILNTQVTTDGGASEDGITIVNGSVGQIKNIYCIAVGNAGDSYKITPQTMVQGTKITFGANCLGKGCTMAYATEGWVVIGNNGGTVA